MIRIEPTTDAAIISNLAWTIWPPYFGKILPYPHILYMLREYYNPDFLHNSMANKGEKFFLVKQGHIIVGFFSYAIDERGAKLKSAFLRKPWRGQHIFRDHIIPVLRQAAPLIHLAVARDNFAAIAAYEAAGFRKTADIEVNIGEGFVLKNQTMALALMETAESG